MLLSPMADFQYSLYIEFKLTRLIQAIEAEEVKQSYGGQTKLWRPSEVVEAKWSRCGQVKWSRPNAIN